MSYLTLHKDVLEEQVISKSRFLCFLRKIDSREAAMEFLQELRTLHPGANHHCWAFIVGDPSGSNTMGMSDDGEPHGTAGKPMLSLLQHKKVGDVMAVVVRYFGGTKLGTGGLVRAYSSSVQLALDGGELTEKVEMETLSVTVGFQHEAAVRRLADDYKIALLDVQYNTAVKLTLEIPIQQSDEIKKSLCPYLVQDSTGEK